MSAGVWPNWSSPSPSSSSMLQLKRSRTTERDQTHTQPLMSTTTSRSLSSGSQLRSKLRVASWLICFRGSSHRFRGCGPTNRTTRFYPETVSYKYFVNVPLVMQWMMGAMKALMSKDSVQRMTWMTYGNQLHSYLGSDVPKEYGGNGPSLEESAITPRYAPAQSVEPAVEVTSTTPAEVTATAPPELVRVSTAKRAGEPPVPAQ